MNIFSSHHLISFAEVGIQVDALMCALTLTIFHNRISANIFLRLLFLKVSKILQCMDQNPLGFHFDKVYISNRNIWELACEIKVCRFLSSKSSFECSFQDFKDWLMELLVCRTSEKLHYFNYLNFFWKTEFCRDVWFHIDYLLLKFHHSVWRFQEA